jgi:hypothetical protein
MPGAPGRPQSCQLLAERFGLAQLGGRQKGKFVVFHVRIPKH